MLFLWRSATGLISVLFLKWLRNKAKEPALYNDFAHRWILNKWIHAFPKFISEKWI